jgi:hypothetical protein
MSSSTRPSKRIASEARRAARACLREVTDFSWASSAVTDSAETLTARRKANRKVCRRNV